MRIPLILAFLFFIGSHVGWGIEVLFRKFFSAGNPQHRWVNPGFLVGPYLPLYGFSLCILYLLANCEALLPIASLPLRRAVLFAVMAVCVTALEYLVGLLSVKVMKVKLWDYSGCWGNIQGIICPLFSFFWMLMSAAYYFFVHPHILDALNWLAANLAFSFSIGFFFGVFAIDLAYSARLLARIKSFAEEHQIVVRFEELKDDIRRSREESRERARFFFNMRSSTPLSEHLAAYHERMKRELETLRAELGGDGKNG